MSMGRAGSPVSVHLLALIMIFSYVAVPIQSTGQAVVGLRRCTPMSTGELNCQRECDDCQCFYHPTGGKTTLVGECKVVGIGIRVQKKSVMSISANAFNTSNVSTITDLYIDQNILKTLPRGLFDNLGLLEYLSLAVNQLQVLPEGIFDHQTALISLDLERNRIVELRSGVFNSLRSLTTLKLGNNLLMTLPRGTFDQLAALTTLDIDQNQLNLTHALCVFRSPRNLFTQTLTLLAEVRRYIEASVSVKFCSGPCSSIPLGCGAGYVCQGRVYNYTCSVGSCSVKVPDNGIVTPPQTSIAFKQKVTFSCQSGFNLQGESNATCNGLLRLSQDNPSCLDIDECATSTHTCNSKTQVCYNTAGTYACRCAVGYAVHESKCTSVLDFIGVSSSPIFNVSANNTCKEALTRLINASRGNLTHISRLLAARPECPDDDECANGTHSCIAKHSCLNTWGSYTCCAFGIATNGVECLPVSNHADTVTPCISHISQLVLFALVSLIAQYIR